MTIKLCRPLRYYLTAHSCILLSDSNKIVSSLLKDTHDQHKKKKKIKEGCKKEKEEEEEEEKFHQNISSIKQGQK